MYRYGIIIAIILLVIGLQGVKSGYTEEVIDWDKLVNAVIQVESSSNPSAYNSRSGAVGLMQITPCVLKEKNEYIKIKRYADLTENYIELSDLYNPKINIQTGAWYLHHLKDYYLKEVILLNSPNMELPLILAAYNGGITKLASVGYDISKMPRETRLYIKKVMKLYKEDL